MVEDRDADERARTAFQAAEARYGWLPNTVRVMVHSESAAEIYLAAGELNKRTRLSAAEREAIAVATAAHNRCDYCLTAHSAALQAHGAPAGEVERAREGTSADHRTSAILAFAVTVLERHGAVDDQDLAAANVAGLDHGTLLDIAAVVAENTLGNYVNNIARTPLDPLLLRTADKRVASAATGVSR
jgi:uncharacterized peroxidase-related enzyme